MIPIVVVRVSFGVIVLVVRSFDGSGGVIGGSIGYRCDDAIDNDALVLIGFGRIGRSRLKEWSCYEW